MSNKKSNYSKSKPQSNNFRSRESDKRSKFSGKEQFKDGSSGNSMPIDEHRTNDPMWYAQNAQLLKDTASFPWAVPLGTVLDLSNSNFDDNVKSAIPGLLTLRLEPMLGTASNEDNGINLAMRKIYSWVRHANSGSANYDAPDLMLYIIGVTQLHSFLEWCHRLYGISQLYSTVNRYLPRALVEAQGVDYTDFVSNLANFRAWVNTLAYKVASFAIPKGMSYYDRTTMLYRNIYTDENVAKAQLYQFSPAAFYEIGRDDAEATQLERKAWNFVPGQTLATVEDIIQFGEDLAAPYIGNEDFNIMSGDIIKAYGSNIASTRLISEGYVITPVHDKWILEQIHNAAIIGNIGLNKVLQNKDVGGGYLYTMYAGEYSFNATVPAVFARHALAAGDRLISVLSDDTSPEMTMEATRLCPTISVVYEEDDEVFYKGILSCGTEVVVSAIVSTIRYDSSQGTARPYYAGIGSSDLITGTFGTRSVANLTKFNYHPCFRLCDDVGATAPEFYSFWEIDNYVKLTTDNLTNLDDLALLSLFTVSEYGTVK